MEIKFFPRCNACKKPIEDFRIMRVGSKYEIRATCHGKTSVVTVGASEFTQSQGITVHFDWDDIV